MASHFMQCPLIALHTERLMARPMRAAIVCLAAVVVAPSLRLGAQGPSILVPGARVRVIASHGYTPAVSTGRVIGLRGDTLLLQRDGDTDSAAIPLMMLTNVETSRGFHPATMKGLGYGFAAGAVAGAIVGGLTYQEPTCAPGSWFCGIGDPGAGGVAAITSVVGGLLGTIVGGVIGHAHQTEDWEAVAWSRSAARISLDDIRFTPSRNGASLSMGLRF